jgi:hypothetical protein
VTKFGSQAEGLRRWLDPDYHGYRPAPDITAQNQAGGATTLLHDYDNQFGPDYYDNRAPRPLTTSLMTAELQWQDTSTGLGADLAWANYPGFSPVALAALVTTGTDLVTWSKTIELPTSVLAGRKLRLRVNEIDYYPSATTPATVDTTLRRPFVAHIPLN